MTLRSLLVAVLLLVTMSADAALMRDRIGVAHAGGKYSVDPNGTPYLREGAQQIRYDLGSRVIKLWLTRQPASLYPFNSPLWENGAAESDLVGIADHIYFRQVFSMPFSTFILVVDSRDDVWFGDGMSAAEEAAEERSLYELTRYLMQTYAGTRKTFVLQNWEADWLLRLGSGPGALIHDREPTPLAVDGMIRWLNARQRGVERARAELAGIEGVTVKHAIEVNHVWRAVHEPQRISVTNDVLSHAAADLYSYSAWEVSGDTSAASLREMLTYLDEKTPGSGNIYVGELGAPENMLDTAEHLTRVVAMTNAALDWGARYVIYWQLYCNEFASIPPPSDPEVVLNHDMRGFWLIRPDGTRSPVWDYLQSLMRLDVSVIARPRIPRRF